MKKTILAILGLVTILTLICTACTAGGTGGGSAADFYKNNTVTLHVNASAGGTTDIGGRVFAQFWAQATGGPAMQVIDHPGGGGYEGLNFINGSPPDGLNIGTTIQSSDMFLPFVTGTGGTSFDARNLSYIGMDQFTPYGFFVGVGRPSQTVDQLKAAKGIKFGATSAASATHICSAFVLDVFNLDGKVVTGYEATELGVACKRGELDGYGTNYANGNKDVANGFIKPLVSLTKQKTVWSPDIQPLPEIAKMDADQSHIFDILTGLVGAKSFYAPPKLPQDKLDYLRATFDKINAMPEFVAAMKPTYPFWDPPMSGKDLADLTNKILGGPAGGDPALKAMLAKYTAK
jgi:tripartite-type tricarboxylate transporter receptor subunit TctC